MKLDTFKLKALTKKMQYDYELEAGYKNGRMIENVLSFQYKSTTLYITILSDNKTSITADIIKEETAKTIGTFEDVLSDDIWLNKKWYLNIKARSIFSKNSENGTLKMKELEKIDRKIEKLMSDKQKEYIDIYKEFISDKTRESIFKTPKIKKKQNV